jgi:hypothetical protein
MHRHLRYEANA